MKAIRYARYGGPEVLELVELPDPVPADDEVMIRIHAAGVRLGGCLTSSTPRPPSGRR